MDPERTRSEEKHNTGRAQAGADAGASIYCGCYLLPPMSGTDAKLKVKAEFSHDGRDRKKKTSSTQKRRVRQAQEPEFVVKVAALKQRGDGRPSWLVAGCTVEVLIYGSWQSFVFVGWAAEHSLLMRLQRVRGEDSRSFQAPGDAVEVRLRANSTVWTPGTFSGRTLGGRAMVVLDGQSKWLPSAQVRSPLFAAGSAIALKSVKLTYNECVVRRAEVQQQQQQQSVSENSALESPSGSPSKARARLGRAPDSPEEDSVSSQIFAAESAPSFEDVEMEEASSGYVWSALASVGAFIRAPVDAALSHLGYTRTSSLTLRTGGTPLHTAELMERTAALNPLDPARERRVRIREIELDAVRTDLMQRIGGRGRAEDVVRKFDNIAAQRSFDARRREAAAMSSARDRCANIEGQRAEHLWQQEKSSRSVPLNLSERAVRRRSEQRAAGAEEQPAVPRRSRQMIDGVLHVTSFEHRMNPSADRFRVRLTDAARSDLTVEASVAFVRDCKAFKGQPGARKIKVPQPIMDWYGVQKSLAYATVANDSAGSSEHLSRRNRGGRPPAVSRETRQEVRDVGRVLGRGESSRNIAASMTSLGTTYRGRAVDRPSKTTINELVQRNTMQRKVRAVPKLKPYHEPERESKAAQILEKDARLVVDLDEKMFVAAFLASGVLRYWCPNHKLSPDVLRQIKHDLEQQRSAKRGKLAAQSHPNRYAPLNEWETFHDSDEEEEASESDDDIRTEIDHKCHVTQGMYLFAVTEPIRNQHGVFLTNGKVGLWRTRVCLPAAAGRKIYLLDDAGKAVVDPATGNSVVMRGEDGTEAYSLKKGDPVWTDVSVDSETYREMFLQADGIADAVDKYYSSMCAEAKAILKVECNFVWGRGELSDNVHPQDDNASGHGVSRHPNTHELVDNEIRTALKAELKLRHMLLFSQAAQSPGMNRCDLGVLYMVYRRARRFWREVKRAQTAQAKSYALFDIVQRTFWDDELVPAMKMFNISKVKTELLKKTIEIKGKHLPKEVHFGVRKAHGTGS